MNTANMLVNRAIDPHDFAQIYLINSPMLRNRKWHDNINEVLDGRHKNIWNLQA